MQLEWEQLLATKPEDGVGRRFISAPRRLFIVPQAYRFDLPSGDRLISGNWPARTTTAALVRSSLIDLMMPDNGLRALTKIASPLNRPCENDGTSD